MKEYSKNQRVASTEVRFLEVVDKEVPKGVHQRATSSSSPNHYIYAALSERTK